MAVPVRLLHSADSPRLEGADDAHANVLAESETRLPPILVHHNTMRVIDGAHRLRAATLRGEQEIQARFFCGSEADAFVLAVEANVTHGLPLSRADRHAAAERIINSHPQWSDRTVATTTGLAAKTVASIRKRATIAGEVPLLSARVGRDGRVRPVDAANGRRKAGSLLRENPTASVRQIAARAGVSQGTVRDVRDRLARGEDPLPPRQRADSKPDGGSESPAGSVARRRIPEIAATSQTRVVLLERLKQDPSLRFSEAGRRLIRLLDVHSVGEPEWDRLLGAVPAHCQLTVAELVRACADMWQDLASKISQDTHTEAR
ncbi:ParB N-terminal domain-containing protein [Lentzea sp. NPDC102401]|uniref:ParB N-terminal domain-containing protein n=1 Tax=Lentzea sp. NPDC102401 TaxID=3364128 RepID=UPI0038099F92